MHEIIIKREIVFHSMSNLKLLMDISNGVTNAHLAFFFLIVVLWLFRCRNDRPNIFNAVQLAVYLIAASRSGYLWSSCKASRVTLCAGIIQ